MEFNFIGIKSGGAATILDSERKPRFICFKELPVANRYVTYICRHKAKFGKWPCVDLSNPFLKLELPQDHHEQNYEDYMDLLEIKKKTWEDLDNMSLMMGISYFYCHEFNYNQDNLLSISIRGQDMDAQVDDFLYREQLDINLKNM
jgi:hypothetical protein